MHSLLTSVLDSPGRLIIVGVLLGLFIGFWGYKRSFLFAWISIFIISFAFNISLQLEFLSAFYDPYVLNIKVNYLVPTLYWLDILFVGLFSYLVISLTPVLWRHSQRVRSMFVGTVGFTVLFWILHIYLHPELVTIFSITRIIVYFGSVVLLWIGVKTKEIDFREIINTDKIWFY
jgi:hypothetical protein